MQYRIFKQPCRFFFDSKILFCPRHDVVSYGCHFTVVKHHSNKFRYMYVICNNGFLHWFRFQRYRINIDSTVVIETFHFKLSPLSIFCINVLFWAKSYFGVDIDDIASISNYIKSANTNNQEQYRYRHKCNATYQVRYRCRYREFMYDFADIDIIKSVCWQCFSSSWLQVFLSDK